MNNQTIFALGSIDWLCQSIKDFHFGLLCPAPAVFSVSFFTLSHIKTSYHNKANMYEEKYFNWPTENDGDKSEEK